MDINGIHKQFDREVLNTRYRKTCHGNRRNQRFRRRCRARRMKPAMIEKLLAKKNQVTNATEANNKNTNKNQMN